MNNNASKPKPEIEKPRVLEHSGLLVSNVINNQEENVMSNTNTVINLRQFIEARDGRPTTTSLQVAESFGKLHKDILKRIRSLLKELPDGYERNFAPIQIDVDLGQGRTRQDTAYRMTRNGFTLLAFGLTGARALEFKIAYIDAFDQMEAELLQQAPRQPAVAVQADEDVIHLHYNRRPLLVYRQGQNFWYRSAHVAALVGGRDSHVVTRSLPPEDTISLQTGNQHVGMISHRALLASLGRLKREDAEALLAWLQLVIPGAFVPPPTPAPTLPSPADAGSLLRAMLAGERFICHLDDLGHITLREIPNDHLIISAERLPSYIADPCGPKRQLLPAILQAVSQRMERAA